MKIVALIVFALTTLHSAIALECYVCTNQDGNTEKCLKTIKTCEPDQDRCLTTISWGSFPYWTTTADKQYYISKQCATQSMCERTWNETLPYCVRIWYLDWRCSECCQGDRCNYFVTLGSSNIVFSPLLLAACIAAMLWWNQ